MTVRISLGCVRRWDVAIKGGGGSISGYWCSVSAVSSVAGVWCLVSGVYWLVLSVDCLSCLRCGSAEGGQKSKYLLSLKRYRGGYKILYFIYYKG